MSAPRLIVVEVVTPEHGATFAREWDERSAASGAMVEAFARSGVMTWPDDLRAQMRFHDIEEEITARIFDELRPAAVEAFVRIASEVLARERIR